MFGQNNVLHTVPVLHYEASPNVVHLAVALLVTGHTVPMDRQGEVEYASCVRCFNACFDAWKQESFISNQNKLSIFILC